jgi:hypothetical protein
MFILNLNKEPHLDIQLSPGYRVHPDNNIGYISNLEHMLIYGTILINKQIWHSSLERDQSCNLNKDLVILTEPRKTV